MIVTDRATKPLAVYSLGLVPYLAAWDLQRAVARARLDGTQPDTLLLLEHPPVYTLGRNSAEEHILASPADIERVGASVARIDRGGEVTYHGPGQLVAYPILHLEGEERSVTSLVDRLEQTVIDTLADFNVPGERKDAHHRGVWTRGKKISSVGLSVKRWVSTHGIALNIDMDLSYFKLINACGDPETIMTSMERELEGPVNKDNVAERFTFHFTRNFAREAVTDPAALPIALLGVQGTK